MKRKYTTQNICAYKPLKTFNLNAFNEEFDFIYKEVCELKSANNGTFDSTVDFSVNANPNTVGTTFSPNTPDLTTVLYISTVDASQWTYNGTSYVTYVPSAWSITGNSLNAANFIGSINSAGLKFRTTNVERMQIFANGNVAVGTTTDPSYKFSVTKATADAYLGLIGPAPSLRMVNAAGGAILDCLWAGATGTNNYITGSAAGDQVMINNRGAFIISANAIARSYPIDFKIANTGNIQIGTNTDSGYKFDVIGTGRVSTSLVVGSVGAKATSALADFQSTTQGLLLPRMTKAQRDLISTPVAGLSVYQTDNTPGLRVYNGTNWMRYTETTD